MLKPAPLSQRAMFARSAHAYRSVEVESRVHAADAHQLVVLLYDELAGSLEAALAAIDRADAQGKGVAIGRALRVLEEGLKAGLDLRAGGDLAANLLTVYDQIGLRLVQARARDERQPLEEAQRLLAPVRDAWRQIGTQRRNGAVQ